MLPVAARVQEAEYYVDGTDLTCVCLSRLTRVDGARYRRETSRLAQSRDFLIVQICFDGAPSVETTSYPNSPYILRAASFDASTFKNTRS